MRGKVLPSFTLPLVLFLSVYLRLVRPDRAAAAIRVRREMEGDGVKKKEGRREEKGKEET